MKRIVAYQSDAIALARIRCKLVDVAYIMAGSKVDVSALGVFDKVAEQPSYFAVRVLFQLSGIDKVKEDV